MASTPPNPARAASANTDAPGAAEGEALLAWYDRHARRLPWRGPDGTAEPYRVWLSEVMLQQTTVAAVIPYFARFTTRWPTVADLAAARDEEVMSAWAGLGYYARARNLLACARAVAAAGGAFPQTRDGLRALPGVGEYTSGAIASIAFGERVAVVDGNVERVIARLLALDVPPKSAKAVVTAAVEAMLPATRPGDFAQAMMDLGATICTPKNPVCALCPVAPACRARALGTPTDFPVKVAKKARKIWHGVSFVAVRPDGAVLLRRRPPKGLLGGMLEVYGSPWGALPETPLDHAPFAAEWRAKGAISHGFTHAELNLDVFAAEVEAARRPPEGALWLTPEEAGLPTLMKKVVVRALADRSRTG
ncbi:A/G-specific adenine glycosylase [Acuticoccus sp. M5D2P5]|uniref:A/G-specific adenine glycosylase n=1 Tax=Acuticoccus kalidii TaxID=2910977 RepID=UPI001F2897D6|nr:A/G-specific adenine glycosylase [Acuticoccus kalidii]MCF3936059.1 A/G-specific adenine glycosylase [Acuticoccus kalidii]